jgi:hypothetical protein
MNNLEKLGICRGEFKIRTCVDDSGDYERKTYDILNCFPWGSNLITTDIANPKHARLFATSSKMLDTLIDICLDNNGCPDCTNWRICKKSVACPLKVWASVVEEATDMTWKEIEESLKDE